MKSLVVLSALATIAIAAPSLLGEHFEDIATSQEILPEPFKRDKKSLPEETHVSSIPESGSTVGLPSIHSPELGSLPASARTLGLKKKPIIVKKKIGYHVYRDSDEERADSRESCPKQVKVKLCNAEVKPNDLSRSSTHELTDGDMKHSIKMAKEAVENLQRDLKNMENNPAIKKAPWKHEDPESDAEIHEDIEVARQALEHIHKNFGNLDSMSLHATSSKDADSTQDIHLTIAKTKEERMAQWKQAFDNIQKNVEIVRNIEDSFQHPNHEIQISPQDSLNIHFDNLEDSELHKPMENEKQLKTLDNHDLKDKNDVIILEKEENTLKHENIVEKHADNKEHITDDMQTSPTTLIDTKIHHEGIDNLSGNHEIKHDQHLKTTSRNPNEASTTLHSMEIKKENLDSENSKTFDLESPVLKSMSMKTDEENTHKTDLVEKELSKKADNTLDENMVASENLPKHTESEAILDHEKPTAKTWNDNNLKQEKNSLVGPEDMNHLAKLSEQAHTEHVDKKTELEKPELRVSNEMHKPADNKPLLTHHVHSNNDSEMREKDALPSIENDHREKNMHLKTSEHSESNHLRSMSATNDDLQLSKSADQTAHQSQNMHFIDHHPDHHPAHHFMNTAMKSADGHSQLNGPLNMRWNQDKNAHSEKLAALKAAEDFKNEFMREPSRNMHFIDQQHRLAPTPKHFDMSNGMHPTHMHSHRLHDSSMHGKSQIMDSAIQPNTHMNMRDAIATFDQDNTFQQWKPSQEAARAAYASRLAYGAGNGVGGAVGVFPNANVGSCGIPLLLSCNPSVVSGSLAKGHQSSGSYGGSAYRTEDDFNFHNKRDTTKLKEISETKLKETPLPLTKTAAVDKKH